MIDKRHLSQLLYLAENLSLGDIPARYRKRLALDTKLLIGDKPTNVVGIDYGGKHRFQKVEPYLHRIGFNYTYVGTIIPGAETTELGIRTILQHPAKIPQKSVLLLVDDASSKHATTLISALYSVLNNREHYGLFDEVYVMALVDRSGFPNLAGFRWVYPPEGPKEYMHKHKHTLPLYTELQQKELLRFIGDVGSLHNDSALLRGLTEIENEIKLAISPSYEQRPITKNNIRRYSKESKLLQAIFR